MQMKICLAFFIGVVFLRWAVVLLWAAVASHTCAVGQ